MFQEMARALTDSIDDITRRWVDSLRTSERTEVHKQLLSAEIVDGVKGMLANLAQAIETHVLPEHDDYNLPDDIAVGSRANVDLSEDETLYEKLSTTRPLMGPLEQAEQAAASLGRLRQRQQYDISEVIYEYVRLRQEIWSALQGSVLTPPVALPMSYLIGTASYIDRLLDELMLITIDNFYASSVRSLEKRAVADAFTQLYNKDYFRQRLNEELRRAVRYGHPLSVVMLDMDNLKKINDTYGHQAGDEALRLVANAVRHSCRQSDIPCRYGGDEFVVILPESNKEQAHIFAQRVMNTIQGASIVVVPFEPAPVQIDPDKPVQKESFGSAVQAPSASVSIGVASYPEDARNPETLVAKADDALYRAKKAGKNRMAG